MSRRAAPPRCKSPLSRKPELSSGRGLARPAGRAGLHLKKVRAVDRWPSLDGASQSWRKLRLRRRAPDVAGEAWSFLAGPWDWNACRGRLGHLILTELEEAAVRDRENITANRDAANLPCRSSRSSSFGPTTRSNTREEKLDPGGALCRRSRQELSTVGATS